jgi:hypothetical protein
MCLLHNDCRASATKEAQQKTGITETENLFSLFLYALRDPT